MHFVQMPIFYSFLIFFSFNIRLNEFSSLAIGSGVQSAFRSRDLAVWRSEENDNFIISPKSK